MAFRIPVSRLGPCRDLQRCNTNCEHFFPAGNVDMEATTIPANTVCLFCECSATAHLQVVSFHILCFNHADCHAPHFLEECPSWRAVWRSRIGDKIVETCNDGKAITKDFLLLLKTAISPMELASQMVAGRLRIHSRHAFHFYVETSTDFLSELRMQTTVEHTPGKHSHLLRPSSRHLCLPLRLPWRNLETLHQARRREAVRHHQLQWERRHSGILLQNEAGTWWRRSILRKRWVLSFIQFPVYLNNTDQRW